MKKWTAVIMVLVLLLGCCGAAFWWYHNTRIKIGDEVFLRDSTQLDLSGRTLEEPEKLAQLQNLQQLDLRDTGITTQTYEMLRQALPACRILWSVPFQSGYVGEDTEVITVSQLTEVDVQQLAYLPNLKSVDARGCRDYDTLMALTAARPDLEIAYTVTVGGEEYREDTAELALENADGEELLAALAYLPAMQKVTFTGTAPEKEQIHQLMCGYPNVTFVWDFEVLGVATNSLATELILSGIEMESVQEVEDALKYFYNLQKVEMCDCGISSEEMDALGKRHPETRFIWTIRMGRCVLRTDVTAFIPYKFGYGLENKLNDKQCADLKYCVDMECLDMGHMAIKDYSFLASMPKLKYLILADTDGTDFSPIVNCTELVFLELFLTEFSDVSLLTGLTKLEDLNLSFTKVTGAEELAKLTWLHRLWIPGVRMTYDEQNMLRQALPEARILFRAKASTTDGWRQSPNYYKMRDLLGMWYLD